MSKKNIYTLPKLHTREELNELLNEMYNNIRIGLIEDIIIPVEFNFMKDFGLTPNQRIGIYYMLDKELNKLTNNKYSGWISYVENTIISSIESSLNSIRKLGKINIFSSEEMVEFIYNIIVYQIDDFEHSPCISEDLLIDLE
jgi:hypothetical protein